MTLEAGHISLPSGILQDWPVGTPLTLQTLASLMISESDNTATDALLATVGREAVEEKLGPAAALDARVVPAQSRRRSCGRAGSAAMRTPSAPSVPNSSAASCPALSAVSAPHNEGAEWYLSVDDALRDDRGSRRARRDAHQPGPRQPRRLDEIAFKGGSEVGVLNLTSRLIAKDGATYCVAATWNGAAALNEQALASGLWRRCRAARAVRVTRLRRARLPRS